MLRVMRIFTGTDLHRPVLRVMVNAYLHFVSTYYLQGIRLDQFSACNCEDFPEPELEMPLVSKRSQKIKRLTWCEGEE